MQNKNLFLAIVLSLGFMLFWSYFVVPKITPPQPTTQPLSQTLPQGQPAPAPNTPSSLSVGSANAVPANDISYDDDKLSIVFSPYGGGVKSWTLKLGEKPLNLVHFPDQRPQPLETFPEQTYKGFIKGSHIVLETVLPTGLHFRKILSISTEGFLHNLTFEFENPTGQTIVVPNFEFGWGPSLGTVNTEWKDNHRNLRALSFGKLRTTVLKDQQNAPLGGWAGLDNRYFLTAFIPQTPLNATVLSYGKDDKVRVGINQTDLKIPARGKVSQSFDFYAGPKGYTHLRKYGKNLEQSVNFGVFSWLGKLMLRGIYLFHGWTGNYGWAIMMLTVLIQLIVLPLTLKSYKAAAAMKKLQPQIAALQAQYKSDPKRLNIEMMNLWKRSGSNPMSGCLPILPQMPIFFALFATIRGAYELNGAPWIFWIKDLSAQDPFYILPLLMGGAMFFQQRLSGAVTDPTQRQMMMMMPVMFTIFMISTPSGLVLYWLTSNLISITSMTLFQRYYNATHGNGPGGPPRVIDTVVVP